MKGQHYFDIDDELFEQVKKNFNSGINSILQGMQEKGVCEGELSLSVKVSLRENLVTNASGEDELIIVPSIEHKAVTKMSVKAEEKGKIKGYDGKNYLSLRKIRGKYAVVLTPSNAAQTTLDEQLSLAGYCGEEEDDD